MGLNFMTGGAAGGGPKESAKIMHDTALHAIESPLPVALPDGRRIVITEHLGPGEQGERRAASWLGQTLKHTYGRHQLSASEEEILKQIQSGRVEPIFIEKNGNPDACAAFVHGENVVEIGRAANAPHGRGGATLMWRLAKEWEKRKNDARPLVAEVRMAAPFEGIDGGQGSQATLLNPEKVGMKPHAFLPAFHHPGKVGRDRQELFCFSSKEKPGHEQVRSAPLFIQLPDLPQMNLELLQALLGLNGFRTEICPVETGERFPPQPIGRVKQIPFHLLTVDPEQIMKSEIEWDVNGSGSPFELLPVGTTRRDLSAISEQLVRQGFICAGISAPHEGPLHLLFARLHKTLLAPTRPMDNFPGIDPGLIMQVHKQFEQAMQ